MSFVKAFEKVAVSMGEHPHLKQKSGKMRGHLPAGKSHLGKAGLAIAILGAGGLALHHAKKKK
jgi:hypothetical protein